MPKKQPGLIDVERYKEMRPNRRMEGLRVKEAQPVRYIQRFGGPENVSASFVQERPAKNPDVKKGRATIQPGIGAFTPHVKAEDIES